MFLQIRNRERHQNRWSRIPEERSRGPHLSRPGIFVLRCPWRYCYQHRLHLRRERLPSSRRPSAHFTTNPSGNPRVPQAVGLSAQHPRTKIPVKALTVLYIRTVLLLSPLTKHYYYYAIYYNKSLIRQFHHSSYHLLYTFDKTLPQRIVIVFVHL